MTRFFLPLIFLALFSTSLFAQERDSTKSGAVITFAEKMKEYGDIKYGETANHTFSFTNTGTEDLIISNVVTTCSCTSRKFTEGSIKPGDSGELIVSFDSSKQDKMGRQNKVITILSNAINNPERVILIVNILE